MKLVNTYGALTKCRFCVNFLHFILLMTLRMSFHYYPNL